MKKLLQEAAVALREWNRRNGIDDEVTLHPPADPMNIDDYFESMNVAFPPSYRKFLELHDGITGLYRVAGSFVSTEYRGEMNNDWRDSLRKLAKLELSQVAMIAYDEDGSAAFFDLTFKGGAELPVIEIFNNREAIKYPSFERFVKAVRDGYVEWLNEEDES